MKLIDGGSLARRCGDRAATPGPDRALLADRRPGGPPCPPARHPSPRPEAGQHPARSLRDEPHVTDFGLAKRARSERYDRHRQILGTPSYMAPEQAAGEQSETGPASDITAWGRCFFALLTGRPPFQAATPMETLLQVLDGGAAADRGRSIPTCPRSGNDLPEMPGEVAGETLRRCRRPLPGRPQPITGGSAHPGQAGGHDRKRVPLVPSAADGRHDGGGAGASADCRAAAVGWVLAGSGGPRRVEAGAHKKEAAAHKQEKEARQREAAARKKIENSSASGPSNCFRRMSTKLPHAVRRPRRPPFRASTASWPHVHSPMS